MSRWTMDPAHSLVEFTVKHMMFAKVKGTFQKFEGYLEGDPNDLANAQVEVTIDTASVDTNEGQRDDHLRSADFFDVENHPKLTFKSKRIVSKGGNEYDIVGDLTIRGITKEVTFDLEFGGTGKNPWGAEVAGISGSATLNRKDFDLKWNAALETGGFLVGDEVKVSIEAELLKEQAETA